MPARAVLCSSDNFGCGSVAAAGDVCWWRCRFVMVLVLVSCKTGVGMVAVVVGAAAARVFVRECTLGPSTEHLGTLATCAVHGAKDSRSPKLLLPCAPKP